MLTTKLCDEERVPPPHTPRERGPSPRGGKTGLSPKKGEKKKGFQGGREILKKSGDKKEGGGNFLKREAPKGKSRTPSPGPLKRGYEGEYPKGEIKGPLQIRENN